MTTKTLETTQVYTVYIKAAPEKVWEAITQPEWSEQYMYSTRVEYDLKPGGRYVGYPGQAFIDGCKAGGVPVPDEVVDGEVLECDPPKRLVQTWRMVMSPEAAPEGFSRLTWELNEIEPGVTKLTVAHELEGKPVLALMVAGANEDQGAGGGWAEVLSGLKTLLETGKTLR